MNKSITTLFFVIIFFVTLPFKLLKIFFFSKKQDIKNHPYLNNNFAPVKQDEQFSTDFDIEGEIPNDLDGVFVRNGPNPKYPILENYHWFDGDGYLHEMELKGGKIVQYKGKYTKTQRLQNEDKAGKKLYPLLADIIDPKQFIKIAFDMFLNTIKGKKSDDKMLGTANTSVEYHANRFFALVESDAPYQVVLPELETLGKYDFEGKLNHPFTAHPKVDPVTNEMLFFGYNSRRKPLLCYSVVNKEGKLIKSVPIDVGSVPIMIHDFAVTENYSVFLLFPLELNPLDLINGKNGFDLNKKKPAKIAVIPRHGDTKDVRYFNISNGYVFHTVNAWEEGDKIHVYGCKANDMSLVTLGRTASSKQHLYNPYLHRWVVDLKKGSVLVDECVDKEKIACEFPTIHPSLLGRKNRFCYVSNMSDKDAILFKSVSKVDLETNKRVATIEMGENRFCGEFVFVPKKNTKDEDDGYLLSFVHDEGEKVSYFYIIDAREFKIAAKVKLQHRVPYGFHGKWVGRSQIESQIKTF